MKKLIKSYKDYLEQVEKLRKMRTKLDKELKVLQQNCMHIYIRIGNVRVDKTDPIYVCKICGKEM